jgi:hypothetical protein
MKIGKHDIIKRPSEVIQDGLNSTIVQDSYLYSYPEFLKYFEKIDKITKHNFIIGINFSYGWMPTIFEFKSDKFDEVVEILNKVKGGVSPCINELNILKSMTNNSLVGSSKLLHFIKPSLIPIWDSRVYKYLLGKNHSQNSISNPDHFMDYIKFCNTVVEEDNFRDLKYYIEMQVGYEMSPVRIVEIVMYLNGK